MSEHKKISREEQILPKFNGNVLFADDSATNRKLVELALNKVGIEPVIVSNGAEAVEKVLAKKFDLILMDMHMPVMTGYHAVEFLRQNQVKVPIIAVTTDTAEGQVKKWLNFGCDDCFPKPICHMEFYKLLGKYLSLDSKLNAAPETYETSGENVSVDQGGPIISKWADDIDFREVAEIFVESVPVAMDKILKAVDGGDMAKLRELIHDVKGAGGSAGFDVIYEKSASVESAISGGDIEVTKQSVEELVQLCQRAAAYRSESLVE